ncbi:hypothetical protein F4859DRAFT_384665 [Xylaria cf. heliscus]|nr:hypothetical protein F4859DRAFT_384665 [Xylaria cf. heliscus]
MKSTTVAFGLFAGLASAYNHHARHVHAPYVRRNETAAPSTTLTVAITSVHTITSCAPTITNCPANAGNSTGPVTVTEVIDLTTTVCPVAEATSISSSVVDAHSSGLVTGTTHVLTTTSDSPVQTPAPSSGAGVSVYPTVGSQDATLTMTLGPEGSQSITVTTIHSTFTQMVTITESPLPSSSSDSSAGTGGSGNGGSGNGGDVTSEEGTTTTTLTSTSTRTVTVPGSASTSTVIGSGSGSDSGNGNGSGSPSVSDQAECAPVTVTVTETSPASTVYVTVGGNSGNSGNSGSYPTGVKVPTDVGSEATSTATAASPTGSDESDNGSGDECPPDETDSDVTATATATVIPYPTGSGNGTVPTGYPVGTGVPTLKRRHALY